MFRLVIYVIFSFINVFIEKTNVSNQSIQFYTYLILPLNPINSYKYSSYKY